MVDLHTEIKSISRGLSRLLSLKIGQVCILGNVFVDDEINLDQCLLLRYKIIGP